MQTHQCQDRKSKLKIYTKTGDEGATGLLGGVRVSKSHPGVEVVGSLDETNCLIGCALNSPLPAEVQPMLMQIQNDLFDLGSRVAACAAESSRPADFPSTRSQQLEAWIDQSQCQLPELKAFILPGGATAGAMLHLARAVCRRTERRLVELKESGATREFTEEVIYLNRLGDLLFVLARLVNQAAGLSETEWAVTRTQADSSGI
jgi:cob(I)alamin adenosyltransferase